MITVYDIGNTDFDTMGDAVLMPLSGKVRQVAGGSYDLTITHPIDPEGKWEHLVPGAIVKVPVPTETIENAHAGYDADIYTTNGTTSLRETAAQPTVITYPYWASGTEYDAGDKVTLQQNGKNYEAVVDIRYAATTAAPNLTYYWKEIARYTGGPTVLATLPAGTELYLEEDVDSTWYKMSTYNGLTGYVLKTEVTFDRHVSPSEIADHVITEQLFRLREPVIDNDNNTVTVTGMHVSYDLAGVLIQGVSLSQADPAFALGRITEAFMIPYRGTVATNLTASGNGTYTGEIKGKNGIFALMDPDKGLVKTFDAKLTRDNWDIFLLNRTATDRGFRIRYGKNMRGVQWRRSSPTATRIVPVAKAADGTDLYLPEKWVDSTNINSYPVILMEQLRVNGQVGKDDGTGTDTVWTEANLLTEMRTKAAERFSVDHADAIAQEVTVQIEMLGDTAEYAALKAMENVLLYDTVTAQDPRIGLSLQLYVTEIEYDILRKKVTGVKLANASNYGGRNVAGYNIQNNSIGSAKLTDEAKAELLAQAMYQAEGIGDTAAVTVIDSLESTSAGDALSANQGKVLNDTKAGFVSLGGIAANSNKTFNIANNSRIVIFTMTYNADLSTAINIYTTGAGISYGYETKASTGISVDGNTANKLKISNSNTSTAVILYALVFDGSIA